MLADYNRAISDQTVWVSVSAGQVTGVLVMRAAVDHLFIDNVAVRPQDQGTGIGGALLAFAEANALSLGRPQLRLYTNELMVENRAYYPRRGFRETGRTQQDGFARVQFVKDLDHPG
jgi:GNAT superfamily N-acetyltransferase